ncbi:MAG: Asp-tRNA(Asn)/Glu-tRNA(Gln) amidotransferase GatCAB subunit B, partial [Chloroflexi bacterium]|nr:Asp-tRNA(Asn)/Glu-tRNA(Gln) amidotransferase GatCAB subunit B [Chloroflexota bacterium]
ISIRPVGDTELGPKVEVKNMNSFRAVVRALEYEFARQVQVVREGGRIVQETRGWVEERGGYTVSQRSKEQAHDYRYVPEPDLPPLVVSRQWVEEVRSRLPELPEARGARFMGQYGLPAYDAGLLTASKATADFFEAAVKLKPGLTGEALQGRAKAAGNWMLSEAARLLNAAGKELEESKLTPQHLSDLLELVEGGKLSTTMAKTVLEEAFNTGKDAKAIVQEKGLSQISDASGLGPAIADAIAANPQAVADYMKGKDTAVKFLVGQVMKRTRGQANPPVVNDLLKEKLEGMRKG